MELFKADRFARYGSFDLEAVIVALLTTAILAKPQQPGGTASGTVTDGGTNAPLEGVLVMISGGGVTHTDNSGRFVLRDVMPGTWNIQALRTGTAPPYGDPPSRSITIVPGPREN